MIVIDLNKQQALDTTSKAIQQLSITGNIERDKGATVFFKNRESILNVIIQLRLRS